MRLFGHGVRPCAPGEGAGRTMEMGEQSRTILVVDDDPDFLAQQQLQLEAAHYRVVTATGQQEARAILDSCRPDLAILDLMMEDMDGGFILSYHLKQKHPQVPIILVTGVTSETRLQFTPAGREEQSWMKADAVLPKPVRFEQLKREIDRLLGT